MTTTVKVHVNGNYRATVRQITADRTHLQPVVIDGDAPGGKEHYFGLHHPAHATFTISEEPLTDEMKAARPTA